MVKKQVVKKEQAVKMRFVDNKDNTLTDQKTGLQIIQDPTLLGEKFQKQMTFTEAEKACAELEFAGYKDWRLPTIEEICGMIDRRKQDPCYDTNVFKGKFDDWYWSRETCAWNKDAAWCVSSLYGYVYYYYEYGHNYVRPVRSSQNQFDILPVR